jgi:hypothetical protein
MIMIFKHLINDIKKGMKIKFYFTKILVKLIIKLIIKR